MNDIKSREKLFSILIRNMARRFTYIPPSTLQPFLKSHEGLKLCNTCKELRSHFLSSIVSAYCWLSDDCLRFGLKFCEYVTRMSYSRCLDLTPTRFPRLQRLILHLARSETFFDLSLFDIIELTLSKSITMNVNPEFLPKNLTSLTIATGVIFLDHKHWPQSLTSLQFHEGVVLDQWPPNLEKLYMSNFGKQLLLPWSLPLSVTSLHLGPCFILDPNGFVPNCITHLIISCGLCWGDKFRDEWISKCEHTIHFETDIKSGPLILPPNVKHVYLRTYSNALNLDQLPLTIQCIEIPYVPNATDIQHQFKSKLIKNEIVNHSEIWV